MSIAPQLLRTNEQFRWLWLGRVLSASGQTLVRVAAPLYVFEVSGSASLTALVTTFAALPVLVLGIPVGAFVDRTEKLHVMRRAEAACSLICALLCAVLLAQHDARVVTLAAVAAIACAVTFYDAASFSVVPSIVDKVDLAQANNLVYGANTIISLVMPTLAAALYAAGGMVLAAGASTAALALAAALLLPLRALPPAARARYESQGSGEVVYPSRCRVRSGRSRS